MKPSFFVAFIVAIFIAILQQYTVSGAVNIQAIQQNIPQQENVVLEADILQQTDDQVEFETLAPMCYILKDRSTCLSFKGCAWNIKNLYCADLNDILPKKKHFKQKRLHQQNIIFPFTLTLELLSNSVKILSV
eukprot:UN00096